MLRCHLRQIRSKTGNILRNQDKVFNCNSC